MADPLPPPDEPSFQLNYPPSPDHKGVVAHVPIVEPWYAQYLREYEREGQRAYDTALLVVIAFGVKPDGSTVPILAPNQAVGEDFRYTGCVRGRQIADLEKGDGDTTRAVTFDAVYDRMSAHRIQQNRIATAPAAPAA